MIVPLGDCLLEMNAIFRHVIAFGASGSGKTAYFLMPFLHSLLRAGGLNRVSKPGALVIDVKGDMLERCADTLARLGREKDLMVIGRGGNAWFDPIRSIQKDPRAVAEHVVEISTLGERIHDEFYWVQNAKRLLYGAAVLAKINGAGVIVSLDAVGQALRRLQRTRGHGVGEGDELVSVDRKLLTAVLRQIDEAGAEGLVTATEAESLKVYLKTEVAILSSRPWSVISNYAQSFLATFLDGKLADLTRPGVGKREYRPELIVDEGKIVVLSLSNTFFGSGARIFRDTIKIDFQRTILQRFHLKYFDGRRTTPINRERPILCVCDEFSESFTPGKQGIGDAVFLSEAREFRCACILATQGISALLAACDQPAAVMHLLNNASTKLFLNTDCPQTREAFAAWSGSQPPAVSAPMFRLRGERTCTRMPGATSLPLLELGEGMLVSPGKPPTRVRLQPLPPSEPIGKNEME